MKEKDTGQSKTSWHPAFLHAIQLELLEYREFLEFKYEFQLTSDPLRIDLLVIKKQKNVAINKNIARIFRTDNLVEYKSPQDYLSVKDFFKVYAYANLYAAINPDVDMADITITFIESRHPRKLLRYLVSIRGYAVKETSPGIYQVSGDYVPIQIIETKKLSERENLWIKSLANDLKAHNARTILDQGRKLPRDFYIDAYMDVLLKANPKSFLEAQNMARKRETFEEVFTKAGLIPEWMERGRVQGIEQGREQGIVQGLEQGMERGLEKGREIIARNLLKMGMSIDEIAQAAELPVEKVLSFQNS